MSAHIFWTYILGPVAALLPASWRNVLPGRPRLDWERAATLSGMLEMLAAIVGLGYWYMFDMTRRMSQITAAVANGQIATGLTEHQVSGAGLTFFYMDFLTWVLFYFLFEGVLRLCGAAFTENVLGTLPLYLLERIVFLFQNRKEVRPAEVAARNAKSFLESVRERVMVARLEDVGDELSYSNAGTEQMLEISSSRRKRDWMPPRTVRVDMAYYRLEEATVARGPRPFHYRLRRLDAGVTGRNVILYQTSDSVLKR